MDDHPINPPSHALVRGLHFRWPTLLLVLAINTGIALVLWIEDTRPFWHPWLTAQCYGLSIAYCLNVAKPWDHARPLRRLVLATAIGSLAGVALVIVLKGYPADYVRGHVAFFAWNIVAAFGNGLLIGLIFYVRYREIRATAALHRAEAERHLLSQQAVEAELKLLQAQVEPHFLFNTLASVQYLTETDPRQAGDLLGHLIGYLRAALPQLRASSSTLGRETALVEAYLSVMQMRIGSRMSFSIDLPDALRDDVFPPNLLISLVENAIKHGIEPSRDGGAIAIAAGRNGASLVVTVTDTGQGLGDYGVSSRPGVGLTNVRERLAALYGRRAGFTLEPMLPRGACATLTLTGESTAAP